MSPSLLQILLFLLQKVHLQVAMDDLMGRYKPKVKKSRYKVAEVLIMIVYVYKYGWIVVVVKILGCVRTSAEKWWGTQQISGWQVGVATSYSVM